jgi:hypothetical protein
MLYRPASRARGQSTHGVLLTGSLLMETERLADSEAVYPRAVYPLGTHPMVIVSEQRLRESLYGGTTDGNGVFPQQGSVRMVREPPHGETASGYRWNILTAIQLASSGWQGSHVMVRKQEDSKGFWCSPATDSCAHKRQSL